MDMSRWSNQFCFYFHRHRHKTFPSHLMSSSSFRCSFQGQQSDFTLFLVSSSVTLTVQISPFIRPMTVISTLWLFLLSCSFSVCLLSFLFLCLWPAVVVATVCSALKQGKQKRLTCYSRLQLTKPNHIFSTQINSALGHHSQTKLSFFSFLTEEYINRMNHNMK